MSEPRGVEQRLQWMVDNEPGDPGWCAKWTWYACGGNQDPPNPPAWGCPNANAVVDKARAAGVLHTDRDAPRGAIVLWTSDTHGHMALSKGPEHNLDIMSTDPYGNWGATGTMPQKWPEQNWGQKWAGWTSHYAGVDLPMGEETAVGGYWYSGKPSGTLTFDDSYKRLDVDKWAPDRDCIILGMLYANIDGAGEIRVRLVRDPDDATAYHTYYIQGGDNFLLTHVWFEKAEAGRKLWWEFQSMDGTTHTIGTRYCKFAVID